MPHSLSACAPRGDRCMIPGRSSFCARCLRIGLCSRPGYRNGTSCRTLFVLRPQPSFGACRPVRTRTVAIPCEWRALVRLSFTAGGAVAHWISLCHPAPAGPAPVRTVPLHKICPAACLLPGKSCFSRDGPVCRVRYCRSVRPRYRIRNENLLMFLSAMPVPRTTARSGSSAMWNGRLVLSCRRLSRPRISAPPPAR